MSQSATKAPKPRTKAAQTASPVVKERKPAAKAAKTGSADAQTRHFNEQVRKALDVVSNPTMLVNRDLVITYANEATKALLKRHREHLQTLSREFDADNIVGTCIDIFHKDPSKQRRILADPSNLPHRADIKVGPLTFALCVSATHDENGTYNGNVFEWNDVTELRELTTNAKGVIDAISRAQAVIEFQLDGTILTANENFLNAMGYTLSEIKGQHHSMFAEASFRNSPEYRLFWERLGRGEFDAGQYKRIAKGGREVWLQASYNPIFDENGKPYKVVKYATDITEQKKAALAFEAANEKAMACVAEFANGNFEAPLEKFTGKQAFISEAIEGLRGNLQAVAAEIQRLTQASAAGLLQERGKADQFKGGFADQIRGTNAMLDAILLPIAEGNRILSLIRGGNLREKVEVECHGDHQRMKDAINGVHDWLAALIEYVTAVANGDLTAQMAKASEQDQIHEWLMLLKDNIGALVADANMLAKAAVEGKLNTRADASKHQGDFRKIVDGVNRTIGTLVGHFDALPTPIMIIDRDFSIQYMNSAGAKVGGRTAQQVVGSKCYDHFKTGDCRTDNCSCFRAINREQVTTSDTVAKPMAGVEIDISYTGVPIRDEAGKVIGALEVVVDQTEVRKAARLAKKVATYQAEETLKLADGLGRLAKGDVNFSIQTAAGDADTAEVQKTFETLGGALNTCVETVKALVADANVLSVAAVEGKLATRADASKHQGDFRKIVQGVNNTLDAVIGPLNVAANYVDQISKGAIPAKIADNYNGDFNVLKSNLNTCIDAVNALVADANVLSVAAVEGKLATRADASKHQGDFRKIVQGVNNTLDAVIGPLNVAANYVDQISKGAIPAKIADNYNGDFNVLKSNLNTCIDAVNALVADANVLSVAAVEGKLATRADASKHQGDFRKIVQGVNDTLNAVIGPLNVAADYIDVIAKGEIPAKITDSYNGDFNLLKNNLNVCIDARQAEADQQAALQEAVQQTQEVVETAQANDLTQRIPMEGKTGGLQSLCAGVNGLLDSMTGVVSTMLLASSTVSSAAAEIASGTNDLAQRTEQQASSLEETAASMEEMAATVKQNADNAQQANQLSVNARSVATEGGSVVGKAVEAMERIERSSDKISEIISVIDEIAFQTNLLALNAAVEAARAGDAGKGFTVVASEVRSLAQRTSVAAKDIKGLIGESGRQVKEGVKLVGNAGSSLGEIVTSINRVADIVAEIAAASKEQASGVEEINKAVTQMDQMTQQNGALVEESAASSRTLQDEAQTMYEKMSAFQIGDTNGVAEKPAQAKRPAQTQHAKKPIAVAPPKSIGTRTANGRNGKSVPAAAFQASGDSGHDWKEF